ncbi:MAG TPA: hypothetical protein VJ124_06110 [Pyrinomonadaceae bacterium]|nr:hypothetical protein [Pyrinomonadaceae bacterium]
MPEGKDPISCAAQEICNTLRYLGDVSYAILPADLAHSVGDLKKSFWTCVRSGIDKEIEWIDERVAGGDRLREQWRQACGQERVNANPAS